MDNKDLIIKYGLKLLEDGLVKANWGNISIRTEEGIIITPSGMDYDCISREDLVQLDLEGKVLSGARKPSSEFPLHLEIYKNFNNINAVVHTHSIYASAFSVCRKEIPPVVEDMVQISGGNIKVAEYALPGTKDLAEKVVEALKGRNACLLANHGLTGIGRTIEEAYKVCLIVEKSAQIAFISESMGSPCRLSDEDVEIMRNNYLNSYGQR